MGIETRKVYVCDRCGAQSDDAVFTNGSEFGGAELTFEGSMAVNEDDDWHGAAYEVSALLCFCCAGELHAYLRKFLAERLPPPIEAF